MITSEAVELFLSLADSVPRHIAQNILMGISPLKGITRYWHHTGMEGDPHKVLPVLATLMRMSSLGGHVIKDEVVAEIGPGQTPNLLYAAFLFGAHRVIGFDTVEYLDTSTSNVEAVKSTEIWIRAAIECNVLPEGFSIRKNNYRNFNTLPPGIFDIRRYDGHRLPIEDESIDLIWSKSVLEHVKNYGVLINEMTRVMKRGGAMCHIIDLRDHYTLSNAKDWLRFLRYSEYQWDMMASNRSSWCNRLRAPEWLDAFKKAQLKLVYKEYIRQAFHPDFYREQLAERFKHFSDEDLKVSWLYIVCKKLQG